MPSGTLAHIFMVRVRYDRQRRAGCLLQIVRPTLHAVSVIVDKSSGRTSSPKSVCPELFWHPTHPSPSLDSPGEQGQLRAAVLQGRGAQRTVLDLAGEALVAAPDCRIHGLLPVRLRGPLGRRLKVSRRGCPPIGALDFKYASKIWGWRRGARSVVACASFDFVVCIRAGGRRGRREGVRCRNMMFFFDGPRL